MVGGARGVREGARAGELWRELRKERSELVLGGSRTWTATRRTWTETRRTWTETRRTWTAAEEELSVQARSS
eukprot:2530112-Rhodomonas_salina.1